MLLRKIKQPLKNVQANYTLASQSLEQFCLGGKNKIQIFTQLLAGS